MGVHYKFCGKLCLISRNCFLLENNNDSAYMRKLDLGKIFIETICCNTGDKMKREVFSICVIALLIFAVIPAGDHAKSVKEFPAEGDLLTGKMFLCHITANGTGRFIWWLMGATFHDFGSIALFTINFKNGGYAKIQSLFNPADCFTVTGNHSIIKLGGILLG